MLNFTNQNQLKELFSLNDFRKLNLFRENDENNIIGYKNLVKLLLAKISPIDLFIAIPGYC